MYPSPDENCKRDQRYLTSTVTAYSHDVRAYSLKTPKVKMVANSIKQTDRSLNRQSINRKSNESVSKLGL